MYLHCVFDVHLQHLPSLRVHSGFPQLVRVHLAKTLVALQMGVSGAVQLLDHAIFFSVAIGVLDLSAILDAVQWWLGNVQATVVYESLHPAEEESKDQCPDMRTIDIGVGHDDDLLVADFIYVELVAFASAHRRHQGPDLLVAKDAVRLLQDPLHVENFPLEGQYGLETAVPPHLGRPTRRLAFDDVYLRLFRVLLGAIGQFSGK